LVPLAFAAFLAILLNPLANRLQRYKIPRAAAIAIAMAVAILFVAAVFYFLSHAGYTVWRFAAHAEEKVC
jgi:predicted PurR-regulated permease PerM